MTAVLMTAVLDCNSNMHVPVATCMDGAGYIDQLPDMLLMQLAVYIQQVANIVQSQHSRNSTERQSVVGVLSDLVCLSNTHLQTSFCQQTGETIPAAWSCKSPTKMIIRQTSHNQCSSSAASLVAAQLAEHGRDSGTAANSA